MFFLWESIDWFSFYSSWFFYKYNLMVHIWKVHTPSVFFRCLFCLLFKIAWGFITLKVEKVGILEEEILDLHEFVLFYTINCVLCWCGRVHMYVCAFFANGKLVSDFKHSKSFRGTFITSRVSTVLQLVLVSLCFMASAYSYSVHYPFGTNRCASNLVRPIRYLFCCGWFSTFS